jgi:fucose 4-O-acetylase-like acetyltransferase
MHRNQFLDFAKGLLIILVTVGHAIQFAVYRGEDFWLDPFFKAIYMFHMPLFMGISGYLAFSGIEKASFMSFSINKIKTYAFPILVWAIVYKTAIYFVGSNTQFSDLPLLVFREFIGSLWFLWALLGCLVLTAATKSLNGRFWVYYLISLMIVFVLPEKGVLIMFKSMFPYFQAGYIIAYMRISGLTGVRYSSVFIASLIVSILCFFLWTKETYVYVSGMSLSASNLPNIGLRFLAGFSVSILAVLIFSWIYDRSNSASTKIVSVFGADSIYIYILQGYVFVAIGRLVTKYGFPETNIVGGSLIALVLGLIIAISCLFIGRILARNAIFASVLFGRFRKQNRVPAESLSLVNETEKNGA